MKTLKKILAVTTLIIVLCFGAFSIYAMDYYRADETVISALSSTQTIHVYSDDDTVIFQPKEPVAGFIFYPGGKVECTAYAPLMKLLAEKNILCVIAKMPYNLAVLDINAADGIAKQFPHITEWYIGGHSLGGSMAASYISKNTDRYHGLVLLAAYSTENLTDSNLDVLSIIGSEDNVLNMEKYNQYLPNLPQSSKEIVINGGNHGQFGNYGIQDSDGTATVTAAEQQRKTADAIIDMIEKNG